MGGREKNIDKNVKKKTELCNIFMYILRVVLGGMIRVKKKFFFCCIFAAAAKRKTIYEDIYFDAVEFQTNFFFSCFIFALY